MDRRVAGERHGPRGRILRHVDRRGVDLKAEARFVDMFERRPRRSSAVRGLPEGSQGLVDSRDQSELINARAPFARAPRSSSSQRRSYCTSLAAEKHGNACHPPSRRSSRAGSARILITVSEECIPRRHRESVTRGGACRHQASVSAIEQPFPASPDHRLGAAAGRHLHAHRPRNGCTTTSSRPDSSVENATHRPSGEGGITSSALVLDTTCGVDVARKAR